MDKHQRCSTRTRTQVPKLVPVPEYLLWYLYPYPCFNMAWYPYSYPYPFHCTRTRTHISAQLGTRTCNYRLVPVPVPTGWYPYPYLVPIPIKSVNPSSFVSIILVPLLLHYPTHCTHVCGFVSLYPQCSDNTDTRAGFVDYFHAAKKRCFT